MSTANLYDATFDSESEGEDFNPEPAVVSDDEDGAGSNEEVARPSTKTNGANGRQNGRKNEHAEVAEDDEDEERPDDGLEVVNGDDDEDDEDDEEDEEDEDAVSVMADFVLGKHRS